MGATKRAEAQKKLKGTVCNLKASESPHGVPDFFGGLTPCFFFGGGVVFFWGVGAVLCWALRVLLALVRLMLTRMVLLMLLMPVSFNAADDQAAGGDDAVDDVARDEKEADGDISIITINSNVSNSFSNTGSLVISSIKISIISSIKSTIRMFVNC